MERKKGLVLSAAIVGGISLAIIIHQIWKKSKRRTLKIFDFDGTIFGSPVPNPNLWAKELYGMIRADKKGGGLCWFQDTLTLDEPYVPFPPPDNLFAPLVIEQVKKSMKEQKTITALLTGRNTDFKDIVTKIVTHAGLHFNMMGFKPVDSDLDTNSFKVNFILGAIKENNITEVEIWEDRPNQAKLMDEALKKSGIKFKIHLIKSFETYLPEDKEIELVTKLREKYHPQLSPVAYTGVFLDEESKKKLLEKFFDGATGWTPFADHMTIKLGTISPDEQRLYDVPIGKKVEIQVISFGESDKAKAVQVRGVYSWNKVAHVTVAVSSIGKPRDSNDIQTWKRVEEKMVLKGEIREFLLGTDKKNTAQKKDQVRKIPIGKIVQETLEKVEKQAFGQIVAIVFQWMNDKGIPNVESEETTQKLKEFILNNEEIKKLASGQK